MNDRNSGIVGSNVNNASGHVSESSHVAVMLCTYNGARHLGLQLESIAQQTHVNWSLWVSDDGSTDESKHIVREFAARHPQWRIELRDGPRKGFAANYMSLVRHPDIEADFIAFCDQDDIWLPQRLAASVEALQTCQGDGPSLYSARTEYIDETGASLGYALPPPQAVSFEAALAQNHCPGNTMLINRSTRALMRKISDQHVASHDWLACLLVTGAGGQVVVDPRIFVRYRQHGGNSMGENRSLSAKIQRLRRLWLGQLRGWTEANVQALTRCSECLTPHNLNVLRHFSAARSGAPWARLSHLRASGVHRRGAAQNLAYQVALAFGLV